MQINSEILVYLPAKGSLSGGGLRCYVFFERYFECKKNGKQPAISICAT
jgi:hypothetical protein